MKKLLFVVAMATCILVGFTSCEAKKTSSIMLEYGWDLDNNGTLSFDNFDIMHSYPACTATVAALKNKGFEYVDHGTMVYTTALTKKSATNLIQSALDEANTDALIKEAALERDFVVRFEFYGEKVEVYRGR